MAGRILTFYDAAMVNMADGSLVRVNRGRPLPSGVADGEEARLESIGAFDPAPTGQTVRVITDATDTPDDPVDVEEFATGGGWYQIGDQKVRGEEAAREALAALTEE